jgi:hypothetical protein
MCNLVKIFNDKHKEVSAVRNEKNISTYGIYMQAYQKESGVNSSKAAKAMLNGTTREATVEALGDIRAMSGFSIIITDPATGLSGTFYITSDSHTFSENNHIMTLDLAWKDTMEDGAETWKKQAVASGGGGSYGGGGGGYVVTPATYTPKKPQVNQTYGYYVDGLRTGPHTCNKTTYHSHTGCVLLKNEKKKNSQSTVHKQLVLNLRKQQDIQGRKIQPCAACWKNGQPNIVKKRTLAQTDPRYQVKPGINTKTDPRYR